MIFTTLCFVVFSLIGFSTHVEAAPLNGPPQQNPDGSCFAYLVKPGDYCDKIRIDHNIASVNSFDAWNAQTCAWNGCAGLQGKFVEYRRVANAHFLPANYMMCLSPGRPALPVSNQLATCGPLVPGTSAPPAGKSLADLNPCPLNACCSSSNQCGTSIEYCVKNSQVRALLGPPDVSQVVDAT